MRSKRVHVLFACAGAVLAAPVLAEDLIIFEEDGGNAGPRGLYNVDSATGNISLRTTVGGSDRLFSLTIDPISGDVYGMDPLTDKLVTIDIDTGTVTAVGTISGIIDVIADITFDSSGTLWGLDRNPPQTLYTIDLDTLTANPVGNTSVVRAGLVWLGNTLYGFSLDGALYEIDPNTGADSYVGGGGYINLLEDAAAGADGSLYFTDFFGDVWQSNPTNGAGTFIANSNNGSGLLGIIGEFAPADCITLSNDGLVAGQQTTWKITRATPGQKLVVVYGTSPGNIVLDDFMGYCATIGIKGVNPKKVIGNPKNADAGGEATWPLMIPRNVKGQRILTQGVGRDTCPEDCDSNVLDQIVQ